MTDSIGYATEEIFGPKGSIAKTMKGFEARPQQTSMYEAINNALSQSRHLVMEAGTGVGKTFAYLIPVIRYAIETKKPVIISTNTINLQEQILYKDIPFLRTALGVHFTAALCKGRRNYLCWRRLYKAMDNQNQLFESAGEAEELLRVKKWAESTKDSDGSLSAMPWVPSENVWSRVCAEHDNCAGKKCKHHSYNCFYQKARSYLTKSNLIIVNHPVLVIDAALRKDDAEFLPKYEVAVIDEAHRLESVAQDHLGLEISNDQITYLLNNLYRPDKNKDKGFLAFLPKSAKVKECKEAVLNVKDVLDEFYERVFTWIKTKAPDNGRVKDKSALAGVANTLTPALAELYFRLKELSEQFKGKSQKKKGVARKTTSDDFDETELDAYVRRTLEFANGLDSLWKQDKAEYVFWMEMRGRKRVIPRITVKSAPLKVNQTLKELLFNKTKTVILTSATLACAAPFAPSAQDKPFGASRLGRDAVYPTLGGAVATQGKPATPNGKTAKTENTQGQLAGDPLGYIKNNLGLDNALGLVLGSPFDYQKQVKMYLNKSMPDPRVGEFEFAASRKIVDYLGLSNGRAFVLFTSYDLMNRVYERINYQLTSKGMPVYIQGKSMPRHQMLEKFKNQVGSVIFGADSFWQGVDVPGEALENIIITKLPFPVPSTPLIEAKIEELEKAGIDSFMNYFLPEAILKMRQGFGRLIRTKTDKGMVAILDSRILNKNYGKFFLDSLPKCPVIVQE